MIDFRYHVVSLVSVFLALAVGVVLGAGPLRGQIADSLNASVEQLRAEKNELRGELGTAQQQVNNRDAFTEAVVPDLVAERLTGDRVALVVLPDADRDQVDLVKETLQAAGARVTAEIAPTEEWTDPRSGEARTAARAEIEPLLKPSGSPVTTQTALVQALLGSQPPAASGPSESTAPEQVASPLDSASTQDALRNQLLGVLRDNGLIKVTQEPTGVADQIVMVAAGVQVVPQPLPTSPVAQSSSSSGPSQKASASGTAAPTSTPASSGPSTDPESQTAVQPDGGAASSAVLASMISWSTLAVGLQQAGDGVVVVGPQSAALETGLVAAIRQSEAGKSVSTVDSMDSPMGQVMMVRALQEQLAGGSGAYGFGQDADAVLPEIPTASITVPTP